MGQNKDNSSIVNKKMNNSTILLILLSIIVITASFVFGATDCEDTGYGYPDCKQSEKCCGGVCTDTRYDENHCGSCENICWQGITCCDGQCVNLLYDENNCGSCGNACAEGHVCYHEAANPFLGTPEITECRESECDPMCKSGYKCCDKQCVEISTTLNCGDCGNECAGDQLCYIKYGFSDYECLPKQFCCVLGHFEGLDVIIDGCEDCEEVGDVSCDCSDYPPYINRHPGQSCLYIPNCKDKPSPQDTLLSFGEWSNGGLSNQELSNILNKWINKLT